MSRKDRLKEPLDACLCDAEWKHTDGNTYHHCDAKTEDDEKNRWCMISEKGQSSECKTIIQAKANNKEPPWGWCVPTTKRQHSASNSSASKKRKTSYRASRHKCAKQEDGVSCGLYTILNAFHLAHNGSFLPTHVHPERDTYTFGNVSLATFLRHFYARTVVGDVKPGPHPLVVDVERVVYRNRIKTYQLVVGFVSKRELKKDRRMVHHAQMDDYKRIIDGFDNETKRRLPILAADIEERLYTENGMVNDNIIEIVLKVFIDRIPSFLTVSPLVAQSERSLTKVLQKRGAGKKHVLVPINHNCHWYLMHYNVEKDAFSVANSIPGTQNIEKEKVVAARLRAFYHGREGAGSTFKPTSASNEDIVVLEEERFANDLKRSILLEEERRGVRLVRARRAYNDRLRALVSDASRKVGL